MCGVLARLRREDDGQVLPVVAIGGLVLAFGMLGLVADVGSWYQAKRHLQSVADAAALAAAQALPGDTDTAAALARDYAGKNDGAIATPSFSTTALPDDTVTIEASAHAPAFFSRLFGVDGVTVHARATARATSLDVARDVVPLAVSAETPQLQCGPQCFDEPATLTFQNQLQGVGGAFGLVNLSNDHGVSEPELASWFADGYPGSLPLGDYESLPGNRLRGGPVRSALDDLAERHAEVMLPVYSSLTGNGANAQYSVVGWAAFRIDSWDPHADGSESTVTGSFERVVRSTAARPGDAQYFGVAAVSLAG